MVALAAGCAAAAALAIGVRVHLRDLSPLIALSHRRTAVTLRVVVTGDPAALRPGLGEPRVAVPVRLTRGAAVGHRWRLSGSALVLAPAKGWSGLVPSQHLTVNGRLLPPDRADLTVAVVSARGPPTQVSRPSTIERVAGRIRAGLRSAVRGLPVAPRGLLPGLVDGDKSGISEQAQNDFRTAGLTHASLSQ